MSGSFHLALQAFEKVAGDRMDQVVGKVVLDLYSRLVQRSPVDTGRFRQSWRVDGPGINWNAAAITADPFGQHTPAQQSAAALINAVARLKITAGGVITISNPLPYGQRLEYGWSKQAPAGMVRVTLAEFEQVLAKAKAAS